MEAICFAARSVSVIGAFAVAGSSVAVSVMSNPKAAAEKQAFGFQPY